MPLSYQTLDARMTVLEDKVDALRQILLLVLSNLPAPPDDDSRDPSDPAPDLA